MKYFIDTEFIERGSQFPVTLISVGIVREDGMEYYAVSSGFNPDDANQWVKDNVLPHVANYPVTVPAAIAEEIRNFVGDDTPEFWGYYADYDWVVFCQLFGAMIDLPKGWPMYCRDIKQLCDENGNPTLPKQDDIEHNALSDARWNRKSYNFLTTTRIVL